MTYASTITKLDLNTWAKIIGLHPLHFNQVAFTPSDQSSQGRCNQILFQHDWQDSDKTGREDVARGIAEAEELIERFLQYRLIPSWESDEWKSASRPNQPDLFFLNGRDIRGYASSVQTDWGWMRSGGIEALTSLQTNAPIVWSDADGDGYKETGTVTYAPVASDVDACELELYYPGHQGDLAFQIRPIHVSLSNVTATITVRREYCVIENILENMDGVGADPADDADFLTVVDVFRHWNDPSQQATLLWAPYGCMTCGGSGCSGCAYSVATGCLHLLSDRRNSIVGYSPGDWNSSTQAFDITCLPLGYAPDLVRLYYYAGWQGARGCPRAMDPAWARAVAYFSLAFIDRPLCGCMAAQWERWREDMAVAAGGDQTTRYSTTIATLDNPFGTMRGALYAWNRVNDQNVARVGATALV